MRPGPRQLETAQLLNQHATAGSVAARVLHNHQCISDKGRITEAFLGYQSQQHGDWVLLLSKQQY